MPNENCNCLKSIAMGNTKIEILSHGLISRENKTYISLKVKNRTDTNIGKALFEAILYDENGVIDIVEKNVIDIKKNGQKLFQIEVPEDKKKSVLNYEIRISKVIIAPKPMATGDETIQILKHSLRQDNIGDQPLSVLEGVIDISIKNISNNVIATAIFTADYLDYEGKIIDTVHHREHELYPDQSRAISIVSKKAKFEIAKSYNVSLIKTRMTDVEKVLLRGHDITVNENNEHKIKGVLKNISDVNVDAAITVTFMDRMEEKIATKMICVNDIEAGKVKSFHLNFTPPNDEKVKTYSLNVGEIIV